MAESSKSIPEAEKHIKQAEKDLKTSLFKWKPDYDVAADEYSKAATCYRSNGCFEEAKKYLHKAIECYQQSNSYFSAGKCYDQIALILKDQGDSYLEQVQEIVDSAATCYQHHGALDTAALALAKGAQILEQKLPEKAIPLYLRGADISVAEDRMKQAIDYVSKAARLQVRVKQYDEAAGSLQREMSLHQESGNTKALGRVVAASVLVHLARDDVVAASKCFQEFGGWCDDSEASVLQVVVQAADEVDNERLKEALGNPIIKNMDIDYARLARDIAARFKETENASSEVSQDLRPGELC